MEFKRVVIGSRARLKTGRGNGRFPSKVPAVKKVASSFRLKKIMVPIDFSNYSRNALKQAVCLAEEFGASILLLHIMEPRAHRKTLTGAATNARARGEERRMNDREQLLEDLRRNEIRSGLVSDGILQKGKPYESIINMAKARNVDLIIMATHGATGLKHVLIGSTTERVVRHAPCPVLVVREKELGCFEAATNGDK
jgi:nucleotide-binding universal stress UspA family protein